MLLNNRYELQQPLGKGGMATVYRAHDQRLNRPVAIKMLHPQYTADADFLQRFEHEAQAAAGLSAHPAIVEVYDVGSENNAPFIVMELVEGRDLGQVIAQEGPLPPERAIRIAEQVADGLEYAHQRGFVHRDVKPGNIMLTANDEARITDFGIAKSVQSTAVTQADMTFGTADYIAPEQAQGLPVTAQSDVYSMGIVVYEMLTGHLPFTGDTPMAVALQQVQQAPPPLRQWNPAVPATLETIVLAALSKDPRQRPASAKAFATMLREYRTARNQPTMAMGTVGAGSGATTVTAPVPAVQPPPPVYQRPAPPVRPRPVAVVVPPLPARDAPHSGSSFGTILLGLLLLGGLLGIAYVVFATDTLKGVFGGGAAPTAVVAPAASATPPPATATPPPTGVPLVTIPNYVGSTEVDVRNSLEAAGLRPSFFDPQLSEQPAGIVIEQEPPAGASIPLGGQVRIRISLGPPTPTIAPTEAVPPTATIPPASPTAVVLALPNLVGQPADQVLVDLTQAGFRINRVDRADRSVAAGQIISQQPAPGTYAPDTIVTVEVSLGDVVVFPNVIGRDRNDAELILNNTPDLRLELVDEQGPDQVPNFSQIPPNQVVSATANGQPVQNGALVPRTATIIIGVRRP